MTFGIIDIRGAIKALEIVRCNMCYAYYYDEIGDPRDGSILQLVRDIEDEEYVKGCGNCQTDAYLMDIENEQFSILQATQNAVHI